MQCVPTSTTTMDVPAPKEVCYHTTHINQLPDIVLVRVFHFVPAEDLVLNVKFVCKRWATVSKDVDVWRGKLYGPIFGKSKDPTVEIRKAITVLLNAPLLENFCADLHYPEHTTVLTAAAFCKNLRKIGLVVCAFTVHAILKLFAERHSSIHHLLLLFYPRKELEDSEVVAVDEQIEGDISHIIPKVGDCENLMSLVVHGSGIFALPISPMPLVSSLRKLGLYHLHDSLTYKMSMMFKSRPFPGLETLEFGHSKCVHDTVLDSIFETCKNLKRLRIVSCAPLTENGFALIHQLDKLQVFHLENCPTVWGEDLLSHIVRCKSLASVHILHIMGIVMQDIMEHWESMPFLRDVNINNHYSASAFADSCSDFHLFEQL